MRRTGSSIQRAARRLGRAGRVAAWLGVLALLIQVAMPLLHQPAAQATGMASFGMPCVAPVDGHDAGTDHHPAPDKPGSRSGLPVCPICLSLQQLGGFLPPVATLTLPVRTASAVELTPIAAPLVPRWFTGAAQPRAPPVLA